MPGKGPQDHMKQLKEEVWTCRRNQRVCY